MNDVTARYDAIADWYTTITAGWDAEPLALLPADLAGQRVLDLACGYGTASRWLARRGVEVTGVDLSEGLLAKAREHEPFGIRYVRGDATTTSWWDGVPYDGVLCNMALMDIDDLAGAFATAASVLEPGGWFSFSVFHPCCPGDEESSWSGLSSWPPEGGYSREGWWSTGGDGIRGRVGAHHRTLSTYLNAALDAGFALERFAERGATIPVNLIVRCRLPGTE